MPLKAPHSDRKYLNFLNTDSLALLIATTYTPHSASENVTIWRLSVRLNLTDLTVQKLSYDDKQVIYWDSALSNFGLRISPQTKSFVVMYGKERRLKTLGHYPSMSLKHARMAAIEFLRQYTGYTPKTYSHASLIGIGYAPRGILRGTVAIPIRLPDGTLIGYIGITEAIVPKEWKL